MTAAMGRSGGGKEEEKAAAHAAMTTAPPPRTDWEESSPARGREPLVHSQVRRIREEDLRIGDGPGEGLSARDLRIPLTLHDAAAASPDAVLCSRSAALPSSPLGINKATLGSAA